MGGVVRRRELLLLRIGLLCIGLLHRIALKRQQTSQLTGDIADLAAQPRLPEDAADGAAQGLSDLSEQVADEPLRRELLLLLLLQLLKLLQLLQLL